MTIELCRHAGDDHSHELQPRLLNRSLPLVCPSCQQPIALATGLCGNRLIQAILLQSERIGTELECGACGLRFVFHRSESIDSPRIMRFPRESLSSI
ncbi:hypothetical protein [Planctomicrobium piriforme]|uniref:Uncharacterized protein n=1 Tax=Planctomicrobium piriforme TaxID=1576369 RepID=A0A1I3G5P2_9PLAN|nr:hypothetical protein [Planctomicrobium piriforme]SFI18783.1 hypothetical protein SAMN05421753_106198 [Planctomicrobium piriforme]